ncbi:MAG: hypothetical protein JRN20_14030 [Nitrososphaerota archaeon]|nr:hypothetical protein [Nitrososphaerota archaeon]
MQNLSRQHWTEEEVNRGLEKKMMKGFNFVFALSKKNNTPIRDAALAITVSRVGDAVKTLGVCRDLLHKRWVFYLSWSPVFQFV